MTDSLLLTAGRDRPSKTQDIADLAVIKDGHEELRLRIAFRLKCMRF